MSLGTGHIKKGFHQYVILDASLNHNYVKITLSTDHIKSVSQQYGFFHAPLSFHLLKIILNTDKHGQVFSPVCDLTCFLKSTFCENDVVY